MIDFVGLFFATKHFHKNKLTQPYCQALNWPEFEVPAKQRIISSVAVCEAAVGQE